MRTREGFHHVKPWRPSEAQRRVLDGLVAGRSNAEIAAGLGLTTETVKWHVAQLLSQTECAGRKELAAWWRTNGTSPLHRRGIGGWLLWLGAALGGQPQRVMLTGATLAAISVVLVVAARATGAGFDPGATAAAFRRLFPAEPTPAPATAPPPADLPPHPNAHTLLATIQVGNAPTPFVGVGSGSLWVPNGGDGTVSRVDPHTNAVLATIDVGGDITSTNVHNYRPWDPAAVAAGGADIWVSVAARRALVRIDPHTNTVAESLELDVAPYVVTLSDDALWVSTWSGAGEVLRIDRQTRQVVARFPVPRPVGIAVRPDAVWVGVWESDPIVRIDPRTNTVAAQFSPRLAGNSMCHTCSQAIAAGEDAVWLPVTGNGTVLRIDPQTNNVAATIKVPGVPRGVAVAAGHVWAGNPTSDEVLRIDPRTNTVTGSLPAPGGALGVTFAEGSLWVPVRGAPLLHRLDPTP